MQKVISSSSSLCGTGEREKMRKGERGSARMKEGNETSRASKKREKRGRGGDLDKEEKKKIR